MGEHFSGRVIVHSFHLKVRKCRVERIELSETFPKCMQQLKWPLEMCCLSSTMPPKFVCPNNLSARANIVSDFAAFCTSSATNSHEIGHFTRIFLLDGNQKWLNSSNCRTCFPGIDRSQRSCTIGRVVWGRAQVT